MHVADPHREPPACPYCGRIMSWREHDEQGSCNDCSESFIAKYDNWPDSRD